MSQKTMCFSTVNNRQIVIIYKTQAYKIKMVKQSVYSSVAHRRKWISPLGTYKSK